MAQPKERQWQCLFEFSATSSTGIAEGNSNNMQMRWTEDEKQRQDSAEANTRWDKNDRSTATTTATDREVRSL